MGHELREERDDTPSSASLSLTEWTSPTAGSSAGRLRACEPIEGCVDQAGECREVVAALEDRRDAWAERRTAARELAKSVCGDTHIGERVLLVRVEPCGDEHQLRCEASDGRFDSCSERVDVIGIRRTCRQWHVYGCLVLIGR